MNDSFLEDLELIPKESKKTTYQQVDRHVTTRCVTSSPLLHFSEQDQKDNVTRPQKICSTLTAANITDIKIMGNKDSLARDSKKSNQDEEKHVKLKISEKNEKVEGKAKPIDARIKIYNKQKNADKEIKRRLPEAYHKLFENRNITKARRSIRKEKTQSLGISTKENRNSTDSSNSRPSDISSKENSRPSDSSRENRSHDSAKEKLQANLKRSSFNIQDQDPVALLGAIKELVSTYTKQESTKILHTMEKLHINSQATLIKQLLHQTDDLVEKMHPTKDSARMRMLVEENYQLQQELALLRMQNEDLRNKLEEFDFLKQENAALKFKCDELAQT